MHVNSMHKRCKSNAKAMQKQRVSDAIAIRKQRGIDTEASRKMTHVKMMIFASSISFNICGWAISLSITIPWISSVSSKRPPGCVRSVLCAEELWNVIGVVG
jgi:hypothetical protein